VQWQVIGRYVFNDTPTWAEALALLLVLYMTSLAVAVGVRDAGHIGLESLARLLPELLAAEAGHRGAPAGRRLRRSHGQERLALGNGQVEREKAHARRARRRRLHSLVVAGTLIVLFCIEHIIALLRGHEVAPAWN
jgi:hypothetical protein